MLGFLKENEKNIKEESKESILFQGQKAEDIKFLHNGLIHIYLSKEEQNPPENILNNSYKILVMEAENSFIGLIDSLALGEYAFNYILSGTDNIKSYKFTESKDIEPTINNVHEVSCAKVYSSANLVNSLYNSFKELIEFNNEFDRLISCAMAYYWFFKDVNGISRDPRNKRLLEGIKNYNLLKSKNLKLQYNFIPEDFEEHQNSGFDSCIPCNINFDIDKIRYFQCLCDVKMDTLKSFVAADDYLSYYHCKEAASAIVQLRDSFKNEFIRSKQLLSQIFSNKEDGLITELMRVFIEVKHNNIDASAILNLIDYLTNRYKEAVTYFEEKYDVSMNASFNKLNILLNSLRPNNTVDTNAKMSLNECASYEFEGNLDRILQFSNLTHEKIDFFKYQIEIFKKMENKDKLEFMPVDSKRKFTSIFFEIYEAVLKRVLEENVNDRTMDMFLIFGFMDNTLLTDQQLLGLNKLLDIYKRDCNVYTTKRWLTKIYNKEKSPSINELGVDYEQTLKEKKAKGLLNGNKTNEENDDRNHKINYEIMNMFQTSHKLCYGQISTYFPVLHKDMLPDDISKVAVTIDKINDSLLNILNVDFSAFHREVFYTGDNPIFKKELIMKQIIPDIILLPTIGTKAIMWQEITGRSKLTPGRFIIPIFTWEDMNSLITKLVGSFRWELCRAVMGARWNDISYKSLTSEYADYIQEYKKNKNLSQENKEKVKIQIQRYHNNLKDIFSSDYESWIKYEAKGNRKVNKEVREILYKYCQFKHSKREELAKQPAFSNIAAQFENERIKLTKELENRYANYVKQGHTLEPELEENLRYYKEL